MTVVSSQEFAINQNKYFDMAMNEKVCVQRGNNIFHLLCTNNDDATVKERVYYEPDEDFYNSISIAELRQRTHKFVHKLFTDNESNSFTGG